MTALLGVLVCASGLGAATAPLTGPFGFLAGMACFAACAPVIGIAAGWWLRSAALRPLDRAFAALDEQPRRFLLSGRAWLGQRGGREVQVVWMRGPILQVTVACDARTRLAVGWKNALASGFAGVMGMTELAVPGGRSDLGAWAAEEEWGGRLLAHAEAVAAMQRLLADDGLASLLAVNVEPDCVMWTIRRPSAAPGPDEAAARLDDLVTLASAVEALPLPESPLTPGRALRPETLTVRPRAGG